MSSPGPDGIYKVRVYFGDGDWVPLRVNSFEYQVLRESILKDEKTFSGDNVLIFLDKVTHIIFE